MTLTIGAFSYSGKTYTAQPFGYEETDVRQGLSARKVRLNMLLTAAQWSSLLSAYNSWRDTRITEPDSKIANSVGTTVAVSLAANGITWSAVACWYLSAPSGEQVGAYVQASVELVVAAEALAVAFRQDQQAAERYYFGTYALGATTVNLTKPPETYQDTPQLSLTASGSSYIQGALTATKVRQIEGDTTASGWAAIQTWYETLIASSPAVGSWYPISAPSASAQAQIIGGVRVDLYTVTIGLGQVR